MDSKHIHQLLDKYWDGLTSLEEEAQLRQYFRSGQVADDLKVFQPVFQYFSAERQQSLSTDFDAKLLARLASTQQPPAVRRRLLPLLARAAAIALIICTAVWWLSQQSLQPQQQAVNWELYEEEDPQKALQEVQKALRLISKKMNSSTDEAVFGLGKLQKATKVIK